MFESLEILIYSRKKVIVTIKITKCNIYIICFNISKDKFQ